MARGRLPAGGGSNAGHQRIQPQVDRQGLLAMESAQCREDEALRHATLLGVDRADRPPVGHWPPVPSTAIRMASASSSDRLWAELPSATGLAKIRVLERPCRLDITTPSRRS